jgi:hypothetical protein
MAYVTVDVELDEFNDQELIDELEDRGWIVSDEKGKQFVNFDKEELDFIYEMTKDLTPGSFGHDISLKIREMYFTKEK